MSQTKDNIHAAVKVDDRKEVKRILEQKKDAVNKRDATEQTPLHVAAMEGHIDTMCLLLKKNANVNSMDKNCWTPLHCAAFSNHLQAMEILLDQGSDVNIANNEGSTPLHYLVRQKVLKEDKSLFNAVLEKMIEKKVDVNMQNVHGYSPLHQACFRQRKWNAKRLLFYKANINIKTK
jgi:ankyrin repeat protein